MRLESRYPLLVPLSTYGSSAQRTNYSGAPLRRGLVGGIYGIPRRRSTSFDIKVAAFA